MSPISPEVETSRTIREAILLMLDAAFKGDPEFDVPRDGILAGFAPGRTRYAPGQIDVELRDLIEDRLVEQVPREPGNPLPDRHYRITSPGRDFVRAKFPWHRIDEYTGRQRG